jgi:hypothetical protein
MAGSLGVTTTTGTFTDLVADGHQPVMLKKTVLIPDVALARGTVMARVTATGLLDPYLTGQVDGTQLPVGILMEDIPIGGANVEALIGFAGTYIKDNLVGRDDAGDLLLEARGIYVKPL